MRILFFFILALTVGYYGAFGQDDQKMMRRDAISKLGSSINYPKLPNFYIVDSVVLISESQASKHGFFKKSKHVSLVASSKERHIWYFETKMIFIYNDVQLDCTTIMDLTSYKHLKVKTLSSDRLRRKYGLTSEKGAFFIVCKE
ncbi:hypothetical protein [Fulvivirga sp.]|uniref:hypothetical protein n=1 Tax=Fulvivirga sp. TaxID=1931237 RepID=UPI0032EB866D